MQHAVSVYSSSSGFNANHIRLLSPVPEGEVNCDGRASQHEYLKNVYLVTLKIPFGILKVSRFSISVFIYSTEASQDEIQAYIRTMIFDLKQQH